MPHARATSHPPVDPSGSEAPSGNVSTRKGVERRTDRRLTPTDLRNSLVARYRHGESVSLVDLSIGGAQFETPRLVRPDADVVLQFVDSRTREVSEVVARILRANVSALTDGITYRAACAFKRPLSHPTLLVPAAVPARATAPDPLKLDLELKAIFEAHFKPSRAAYAVGRRDPREAHAAFRPHREIDEPLLAKRCGCADRPGPVITLPPMFNVLPALRHLPAARPIHATLPWSRDRLVAHNAERLGAVHGGDAGAGEQEIEGHVSLPASSRRAAPGSPPSRTRR